MILIKNKSSIQKMQEAGRLLAGIFDKVENYVTAGATTFDIDQWISYGDPFELQVYQYWEDFFLRYNHSSISSRADMNEMINESA